MGHAVSGHAHAPVSQDYAPVNETVKPSATNSSGCSNAASGAGVCDSKQSNAGKQALQAMLAKSLLEQANKDDGKDMMPAGGIKGGQAAAPQAAAISYA